MKPPEVTEKAAISSFHNWQQVAEQDWKRGLWPGINWNLPPPPMNHGSRQWPGLLLLQVDRVQTLWLLWPLARQLCSRSATCWGAATWPGREKQIWQRPPRPTLGLNLMPQGWRVIFMELDVLQKITRKITFALTWNYSITHEEKAVPCQSQLCYCQQTSEKADTLFCF